MVMTDGYLQEYNLSHTKHPMMTPHWDSIHEKHSLEADKQSLDPVYTPYFTVTS